MSRTLQVEGSVMTRMNDNGDEPRERRRGRYPQQFRRDAATMVIDQHRVAAEVARELGINEQTLGNWVRRSASTAASKGSDERGASRSSSMTRSGSLIRRGGTRHSARPGRTNRYRFGESLVELCLDWLELPAMTVHANSNYPFRPTCGRE
jgi:Transposase